MSCPKAAIRARIQLVGTMDIEETRSHHRRSEQSIPQEDSQVWFKGFTEREGSP